MEEIHINIWDDFYDDGYVPEGKTQKSYIYVEQDMDEDMQKEVLEFLLLHINSFLDTKNVKIYMKYYDSKEIYPNLVGTDMESMLFTRWEIKLDGITHALLNQWIEKLDKTDLKFENIPLNIYSES